VRQRDDQHEERRREGEDRLGHDDAGQAVDANVDGEGEPAEKAVGDEALVAKQVNQADAVEHARGVEGQQGDVSPDPPEGQPGVRQGIGVSERGGDGNKRRSGGDLAGIDQRDPQPGRAEVCGEVPQSDPVPFPVAKAPEQQHAQRRRDGRGEDGSQDEDRGALRPGVGIEGAGRKS
jgi:hypothetical protein